MGAQEGGVVHGYAAVGLQQAGVAHLAQVIELDKHVCVELLAAEAGLDGHDEHHVRMGQQVADAFRRGAGFDGQTRLHAAAADCIQHRRHVARDFRMDGQHGRASVAEHADVLLRIVHHQMDVQGQIGELRMERRRQRGAEGEIRHEMGVHDIHMEPVRPGVHHALHVAAHVEGIGSQNGRGNFHRGVLLHNQL